MRAVSVVTDFEKAMLQLRVYSFLHAYSDRQVADLLGVKASPGIARKTRSAFSTNRVWSIVSACPDLMTNPRWLSVVRSTKAIRLSAIEIAIVDHLRARADVGDARAAA